MFDRLRILSGFIILAFLLASTWGFILVPRAAAGTSLPARPDAPAPNPKLDNLLNLLAASDPAERIALTAGTGAGTLRITDGQVEAIVYTREGQLDEAAAAVAQSGGAVVALSPGNERRFKATLPIAALESLAEHQAITYITRPQYLPRVTAPDRISTSDARGAGLVTTEALASLNAPAWHARNIKGRGIKIGIIDAGFLGYTALMGTELPSQVTVANYVAGEGDAEVDGGPATGTACAEIIHDIAPLSGLYLAKVDDADDLAVAAAWMAGQGVKVISTALGWYTQGPGDGSGPLGEAVTQAKNDGLFWAAAAGDDRRLHWGGDFDPIATSWGGEAVTAHLFHGTDGLINCFGADGDFPDSCDLIPAGTNLSAYLRWEVDNWDQADVDYNLYLVRWKMEGEIQDWVEVAQSEEYQSGTYGQHPFEAITGYTTTGDPTYYGFYIRKKRSHDPDVNLEIFTPGYDGRLMYYTTPRSLAGPADATDAVTVTAVDVSGYAQEEYSAEGPRNGPKGAADGATVMKPDLAAYARVSTATFGVTAFQGSAAAAAHLAGAAALVLSANPGVTVAKAREYLEYQALDLGPAGPDYLFGQGRLTLGRPPVLNMDPIYLLLLLHQ
jgi:hypothetical protein